jgi:serine protease
MKRVSALVAVLAIGFVPAGVSRTATTPLHVAGRAPVAARTAARYRDGELIVQFRRETLESQRTADLRGIGGVRARRARMEDRWLVTLETGVVVEDAVRRLRSMPEVDYAEPNGVRHKHQASTFSPNDTFFRFQWNLKQIGAERMWAIQKGKSSVAVAILDTGVAYEDFGPYRKAPDWGNVTFLPGHDFINDDDHPNDDEFHGTHVASTVAEATNNDEGMAGVAFDCAILPVKVLDANGSGDDFVVADGIDFAAGFSQGGSHPVKVINMSLGGPGPSETIKRAVDRAVQAGVVVVASAGNDGTRGIDYPAALPNVISVGALDERKVRAPYSDTGPELSVVAPGGNGDRDDDNDGFPDVVFQQMPDPDFVDQGRHDEFCYCGLEGTSMASPHVAALAALLIAQGITDPAAVKAAIESTADDLGPSGRDDEYGHGLINPARALSGLGWNDAPPQ